MPIPVPSWTAPLSGWVKINCDAFVFSENVGVGVGCCARSNAGGLFIASARFINVYYTVLVAELEAIASCQVLAVELDLSKVIIESDAKSAIDLILDREGCLNEFGSLLHDIDVLSHNRDVIFVFAPRNCNNVAHGIARYAGNARFWRAGTPNSQIDCKLLFLLICLNDISPSRVERPA